MSGHGGPMFTHQTIVVARLEELAIEASALRQECVGEHPTVIARRLQAFTAEVERLARQSLRHLQAAMPESVA